MRSVSASEGHLWSWLVIRHEEYRGAKRGKLACLKIPGLVILDSYGGHFAGSMRACRVKPQRVSSSNVAAVLRQAAASFCRDS